MTGSWGGVQPYGHLCDSPARPPSFFGLDWGLLSLVLLPTLFCQFAQFVLSFFGSAFYPSNLFPQPDPLDPPSRHFCSPSHGVGLTEADKPTLA